MNARLWLRGLAHFMLYRERKSVMCRFLGADNDEALRMSASRAQKRQGKKSREVGHWFAREVSEFLRR
jgi:hypothetical protein